MKNILNRKDTKENLILTWKWGILIMNDIIIFIFKKNLSLNINISYYIMYFKIYIFYFNNI